MKIFQFILIIILVGILCQEIASNYKIQTFIVKTGSMEPSIPTKSLIVVIPKSKYEPGDVITRTDQNTVTHRIISIQNDKYIQTKGDANNFSDPFWITKDKIAGSVLVVIPYFQSIGFLLTFTGLGILGGKLFRKLWVFGMLET